MSRINISSGAPWEEKVGYSRAVRIGNIIEVTGTTAADKTGRIVCPHDAYGQTMFCLQKIEKAVVEADASLSDIIRTRIFVTDIAQWEKVGSAHKEFFGTILPATTMVQVAALIDPEMLVEIEASAVVSD